MILLRVIIENVWDVFLEQSVLEISFLKTKLQQLAYKNDSTQMYQTQK